MVSGKDMEQVSGLMERDTLGSGCRMACTGMEYTDSQVKHYIKDNSNKIKEKVMDITGMQLARSILGSGRMVICTERELSKRMASYTESNMKKASV